MRQIIGEYPAKSYVGGKALPHNSRRTFDSWATQSGGYFELIAPYLDDFATHHGGSSLTSINALMVLDSNDLEVAIRRTDQMIEDFSKLEISWRFHQGSEKNPGSEEHQVLVTLYKRRLLNVVFWLRSWFAGALERNHCMVAGNGVCYRMLAGIPHGEADIYS
jgi:hypothetical protein